MHESEQKTDNEGRELQNGKGKSKERRQKEQARMERSCWKNELNNAEDRQQAAKLQMQDKGNGNGKGEVIK